MTAAFKWVRIFPLRNNPKATEPFTADWPTREVAAMGVHPAGDRLFVVIDGCPSLEPCPF